VQLESCLAEPLKDDFNQQNGDGSLSTNTKALHLAFARALHFVQQSAGDVAFTLPTSFPSTLKLFCSFKAQAPSDAAVAQISSPSTVPRNMSKIFG
jgi:hypothetical protein